MSKETGGFLRKVARFVANPTTEWSDLGEPTSSLESEYAKTEIKAMIERKRRNDFVRKRELDMLRKIRREGLSPDNALAFAGNSNLDSESRPNQNGPRSDIAVRDKIDAIEQQMVGDNLPRPTPVATPRPAPAKPRPEEVYVATAPNRLGDHDRAPILRNSMPPLEFDPPTLNRPARSVTSPSDSPPAVSAVNTPTGFSGGLDVSEVEQDPDLDEAVIAFANADFEDCERALLELITPQGLRHHQPETWMVAFDLYRALDLPQKFDQLAISFAHQFGLSAPQWYSLPQRVTAFLAEQERQHPTRPLRQPEPVPETKAPNAALAAEAMAGVETTETDLIEGWVAPAVIDTEVVTMLRAELLQLPRPWTLDWSAVHQVTPEAAAQLGELFSVWLCEPLDMAWIAHHQLLSVLADAAPSGSRSGDPAYWMTRMDVLRLINRPDQFDEVAIDYCVTYELSPPSWEPSASVVRLMSDGVTPYTMPLSRISEITTDFVVSQLHQDAMDQVGRLHLSGQMVGDITPTLAHLDQQLGASTLLDIDCSHLLRVDFIAAGDLLNWVLARRQEHRQITFIKPHRLVALFFGAMGITEHAKVKLLLT